MISKLVSIIIPCYNVGEYLQRFIDSVLSQTYDKIELIFINDGSQDNTEAIIKKNIKNIEKRGFQYVYIKQENKGLGGAINTGLKNVNGEFFCWPDPDDILTDKSIEKRVDFLERNEHYAVVTSDAEVYNSTNLNSFIYKISKWSEDNYNENQFLLLLQSKSIFCPGCHLVRTTKFLEANPKNEIYPARRGQNWQLLLPLYYKFKRGFLDEPLYKYIIYENSMSNSDTSFDDRMKRYQEHRTIVVNTLNKIDMSNSDRNRYIKLFDRSNIIRQFNDSVEYRKIFYSLKFLFLLALYHRLTTDNIKSFFYLLKKYFIN